MFELRLMCLEDRVEPLSDALDALDALSVSVEDADAQTDAEQALFGEPGMPPPKDGWQRSRVLALFPDKAGAKCLQLLQAQDFFDGCEILGLDEVPEQDWVRSGRRNSPRWRSRLDFLDSRPGMSPQPRHGW